MFSIYDLEIMQDRDNNTYKLDTEGSDYNEMLENSVIIQLDHRDRVVAKYPLSDADEKVYIRAIKEIKSHVGGSYVDHGDSEGN